MSNQQKWKSLFYTVKEKREKTGKFPLVDLETFFDGNDEISSIASNLYHHPGIQYFYKILHQLELREDVQGIYIGIVDINEFATPEETELMAEWPYSDRICIATSSSLELIKEHLALLMPDEVHEMDAKNMLADYMDIPQLREEHKWIQVWWD